MSYIGILGAGTWGIALARMFSDSGHKVTVWYAVESEIHNLKTTEVHPKLLEVKLPKSIVYTILEYRNIEQTCSNVGFYNSLIIQHQI